MTTSADTLTPDGWDAVRLIVALVTANSAGDMAAMNSLVRDASDDLARKAVVFAAVMLCESMVSDPVCVRSWAASTGLRALTETVPDE